MFQDESRFGLTTIQRRRITNKGVKPIGAFQMKFENYYLYGAVEPKMGNSFFLELPNLDSSCFQVFLNELSLANKDFLNLMILDNGACHRAKKLNIPSNIKLIFLPPYSPELNPIERLWKHIKDNIAWDTSETLINLKDKVANFIVSLEKKFIQSLTFFSYLKNNIYDAVH